MRFNFENLPQNYLNWLSLVSKRARANIIKMTSVANSGHPGGSMSSIDIYISTILFSNIFENYEKIHNGEFDFSGYDLNLIEKKKEKFILSKNFIKGEDFDSFIISHGHTSPGWYAALISFGILDEKEVNAGFRFAKSPFAGHVEHEIPLIEWDTGNLGQGLSAAAGKALYFKRKKLNSHVWVFMGDGEQQKGQISEARRFIRKFDLTNITVFIDYNKLQISGSTDIVMPQNLKEEWEAAGFKVFEIDGHDFNSIYKALKKSYEDKENNYCFLARTVMGKGVSFMENKEKYHGSALPVDLAREALKELGEIDDIDELLKLRKEYDFSKISENLKKIWNRKEKRVYFINELKNIKEKPESLYQADKSIDCRTAYGEELVSIAKEFEDIFVFDCDLAGSVKTDIFEKSFKEKFYQTGIQEHHASTCAGFLSKENALVFFSDFAIFGFDETFNQHRLNDINGTNLKAVYTHAGTNVGEDGKTHHCINYISLPGSYFNSKLILPADPNQTKHIVRYISRNEGNYFVVMGRAKTPIVLNNNDKPYFGDDYKFEFGKPDYIYDSHRFKLEDTDIFIVSCGPAFGDAYLAYKELLAEYKNDIKLTLVNISTPNFIDLGFINLIKNKAIIITEDHNINNGLAANIYKNLGKFNISCKVYSYGINSYAPSGDYKEIYKIYGINKDSIKNNVKNILKNL